MDALTPPRARRGRRPGLGLRLSLRLSAALLFACACAGDDLGDDEATGGATEATEAADSDSSAPDDPTPTETATSSPDDASTDTSGAGDTAPTGELFHTCLHYCDQEVACAAEPPEFAVCFNDCMDATAACADARTTLYRCLLVHEACADWSAGTGCDEQASAVADLCASGGS